ncbi:MAG: zinc-ribbon domain-containing protein [Oscillospiraceae bacterium]|nr:zinc-ribbon domain-containing protein [Oscillospiraceae bacterium]
MFCAKCGAEIKDNAKFCPKCGMSMVMGEETVVTETQVSNLESTATIPPKSFINKKIIVYATGVILAVILIISMFSLFGGKSYEKFADKYVDAAMGDSGKDLVNLFHKSTFEISGENKKELAKEYQEILDYSQDVYKETFGRKWKYSYVIDYVETTDDKEDIYFALGYYYPDDILGKISEAAEISIEISVSGKGIEEVVSYDTIIIAKISGKWYLVDCYSY